MATDNDAGYGYNFVLVGRANGRTKRKYEVLMGNVRGGYKKGEIK